MAEEASQSNEVSWPYKGPGFGETYNIPLTEAQFASLGKIASLFAALETDIDLVVMRLSGISNFRLLEILLDRKQFRGKLDILIKLAKKLEHTENRAALLKACNLISELVPSRNHAIHGRWGVLAEKIETVEGKITEDSKKNLRIAANLEQRSEQPLLAEDLDKVLTRVEVACRAMGDALRMIVTPAPYPQISLFTAYKRIS